MRSEFRARYFRRLRRLSFFASLDRYKGAGWKKVPLIFMMSDETLVLGLVAGIPMVWLFGPSEFMLPAMGVIVAVLVVGRR